MASERPRLLFLCTGNSCRSQMAEGLVRHIWPDRFEVRSAGIERHGLNPRAVRVMSEVAIDISNHESKTVHDLGTLEFDYVVTVCGHANETCPVFPGKTNRLHVGFDDPPKLAADAKTEDEALVHYRRVRDDIESFVRQLPDRLAVDWGT